jgi:putative two-component system response regulator
MVPLGTAPEALKSARILIVDDEVPNIRALLKLLKWAGYSHLRGLSDPREVAAAVAAERPDLLLLDLHMPHLDGFEIMDIVRPLFLPHEYFPVLVLTGDMDDEVRTRALAGGAKDFLTKPFEQMEVLLRIRNLLETRRLHVALRKQNELLEEKVMDRTRALYDAQTEILFRLALAAEYRDDVTGQHAERVGILSAMIAVALDLHEDIVSLIRRAAPLHDVGKIGIPDAILMKPSLLTPAEFAMIKTHVDIGADMLSGGSFELLRMAETIAQYHHEMWDGHGYKGLVGDEIPLVGRIVTVADVYDVITSDRPYKRALGLEEALERIEDGRGNHFDPTLVDAFQQVVRTGRIHDLKKFAPHARQAPDRRDMETHLMDATA